MKTVLNLVLAACVICLVYICYGSIMGPINFDNAKKTIGSRYDRKEGYGLD